MVVVDLKELSAFGDEENAFFVLSVDGQGGQVAEVQLHDVVAQPGDYLQVVDGDCFFEEGEGLVVGGAFAHFFEFEEGVLLNEEGLEVEQPHEVGVVFVVLGHLVFLYLAALLQHVVVLLSELKNEVGVAVLVEAAHYSVRQQEAEGVLELEALADEDERRDSCFLLLLPAHCPHSVLLQSAVVRVDLLRELQMHVVEVDAGGVFVVVHGGYGEGGDRQ